MIIYATGAIFVLYWVSRTWFNTPKNSQDYMAGKTARYQIKPTA